jgi:CDGSH-type Zn-finger protein/ferredoxin
MKEPTIIAQHREQLAYLLTEAAEIEHGILCCYLFAAYSLKRGTADGLDEHEAAAVARWRGALFSIAIDEMLHLSLVSNLLASIGFAPQFQRANLPVPPGYHPSGVVLALAPFGLATLNHFIFLERPEGVDVPDGAGFDAPPYVERATRTDVLLPSSEDYATVGHLYRGVRDGFTHLASRLGEPALFVGAPAAQVGQDLIALRGLLPVTDLASAHRAIDTIVEQGEGTQADTARSHYRRFVTVRDEYVALVKARPNFQPAHPVARNPVMRKPPTPAGKVHVDDPKAARVMDLGNALYGHMLRLLARAFGQNQDPPAARRVLIGCAIDVMNALSPVGEALCRMPAGSANPGVNAGISFAMARSNLGWQQGAVWPFLVERTRDLAAGCSVLSKELDASLAATAGRLVAIASRLEQGSPLTATSAHAAAAPTELARTIPAADDGRLPAHERAELLSILARARELETDLFIAHIGTASGDGERFHRAAQRMSNSVIRPLSAALSPESRSDRTEATASAEAGPKDPQASAGRLSDDLWELAKAATTLRVRLGQPTEIQEACAALQDLACQFAPEDGARGRLAKLAELKTMQAPLPAGIQAEVNGPYLVTNAENLVNWRGDRISPRPQMALCRCGGSRIKPFCDGTHARINFVDVKDPKRVPDRRETYAGKGLTVFDNRGTCAHSGFCTDGLPSVFRVDKEPFVDATGGEPADMIRTARACPSGALSYAVDGGEAPVQDRAPSIEVSKDGPYRIRGGIPLADGQGKPVPRNEGASQEHYSLCRCGHSQNKPFCSGMHWYVHFRDPETEEQT